MNNIQELINIFENYDTSKLNAYIDLISTKENGQVFPPYIPFVGENYKEKKIFIYGMAQNLSSPIKAIDLSNKQNIVCQLRNAKNHNKVFIAPYRVMLALTGIYIYAKDKQIVQRLEDVHNVIAVTNYYKFSLHKKNRDINPNKLNNYISSKVYFEENDKLVKEELKLFSPKVVICFKGKHVNQLRKLCDNVVIINDPAWILRGAGGLLKKGGAWYRECSDQNVINLINGYISQLKEENDKYSQKDLALYIYLLKYYMDWNK